MSAAEKTSVELEADIAQLEQAIIDAERGCPARQADARAPHELELADAQRRLDEIKADLVAAEKRLAHLGRRIAIVRRLPETRWNGTDRGEA